MQVVLHFLTRLSRCFALPLKRKAFFILMLAALLLFNAQLIGRPTDHWFLYAQEALLDLYVTTGILSLLPRLLDTFLRRSIFIVIFCFCFIESFLFQRFHLFFSPTILNLVMETNGGEAYEFLSGIFCSPQFWYTLGLYILFLIIILLLKFYINHWAKPWFSVHQKLSQSISCVILLCLTLSLPTWLQAKHQQWQYLSNNTTQNTENIPAEVFFTAPYRLIHASHAWKIAQNEIASLLQRMKQIHIDSCNSQCPNIVVVIGESYNKHHASLYGYALPTTPNLSRLAQEGSLITFTNVISPWNFTSNAFKAFLSTHSQGESGNWTSGVLFPTLFRRAGYNVAFITQQFYKSLSQGSIDFNGSFFLNDPVMDTLCFDFRNRFRSLSEDKICSLLKNYPAGTHNLYLLHLYGQHMNYESRYPQNYKQFQETDIPRPELSPQQRAIIAHYDNATHYNDLVLAKIFEYFQQEDVLILYFSDHGEEVYDGNSGIYGRNHSPSPDVTTLRNEYEIPFLVWGSPKFRRNHPSLFQQIYQARHRPFSHDDLPHFLLGLAGIQTPYYKASHDPLSSHFISRPRLVRDSINYDHVLQPLSSPSH